MQNGKVWGTYRMQLGQGGVAERGANFVGGGPPSKNQNWVERIKGSRLTLLGKMNGRR